MITLGVTGGMGSGKSEFCKELASLGATVLYADDLAKELMQKDPILKAQIIGIFGEQSYLPSGELNRKYLAKQAFKQSEVNRLNEIVHPRVREETQVRKSEAESKGVKLFVKEAALLLLEGRPKEIDYVVLLMADQKKRIQRIQERDYLSMSDILDRMNKQQTDQEMERLSDLVIHNDGSIDDLKLKAKELYHQLVHEINLH